MNDGCSNQLWVDENERNMIFESAMNDAFLPLDELTFDSEFYDNLLSMIDSSEIDLISDIISQQSYNEVTEIFNENLLSPDCTIVYENIGKQSQSPIEHCNTFKINPTIDFPPPIPASSASSPVLPSNSLIYYPHFSPVSQVDETEDFIPDNINEASDEATNEKSIEEDMVGDTQYGQQMPESSSSSLEMNNEMPTMVLTRSEEEKILSRLSMVNKLLAEQENMRHFLLEERGDLLNIIKKYKIL